MELRRRQIRLSNPFELSSPYTFLVFTVLFLPTGVPMGVVGIDANLVTAIIFDQ